MNILSFDATQFSSLVQNITTILEKTGFSITPTVIETLRHSCSELDREEVSILIDIAIHTRKALYQDQYKKIFPWYFTEQTLMQCSEPSFAQHVMTILDVKGARVVESCTGAGMHALSALKEGASEVISHETNHIIGYLATINASLHGYLLKPMIMDGALANVGSEDIFWADPSRRKGMQHRRGLSGYYSPELEVLIAKAKVSKRGGIKIAPGERIEGNLTREFLGIGRECREQILWFHTSIVDGQVTLIDKQKTFIPQDNELIPELIGHESIARYNYILEPHPALIRGSLSANYNEFGIVVFDRNIAYGLSQEMKDIDWYVHFNILHCERFSRKRLQELLVDLDWNAKTEIKKRGFPMEPDEVRKQLQFSESDQAGVIILTRCNDDHMMILCKRV
ncbi:hypothetical protein LBMAG35_11580 [Chlorobiota bacterium]|nr:hypothetical protein LBMAG35_11580 [Chlorobiota bacterium]